MSELGKTLLLLGLALAAVGGLLMLSGKLPWLGRLPGDITYKSDHVTVYFPIVTCLVLSVILSILFYLFRR